MSSVAKRYGESLFELALETNQLKKYCQDVTFIQESLDQECIDFFSQPTIEKKQKIALIDQSFKDSVHPYCLNFLKLLIEKQRMNQLLEILTAFTKISNEYLGIKTGMVYGVYPLTKIQMKQIEKALSTKHHAKIQLEQTIDESLIGGIKIVIGDQVIDDTIKNQIEGLKSEILKGK